MIYILTLTFFILQLLDWYTTRTILKQGGYEQNPIMAYLFKRIGSDLTLGIKVILVTYIGYVLACISLVFTALNLEIPSPLLIIPPIMLYIWVIKHNWKSL
jgi:hypothetical protein